MSEKGALRDCLLNSLGTALHLSVEGLGLYPEHTAQPRNIYGLAVKIPSPPVSSYLVKFLSTLEPILYSLCEIAIIVRGRVVARVVVERGCTGESAI
jgi:hypothetical protein